MQKLLCAFRKLHIHPVTLSVVERSIFTVEISGSLYSYQKILIGLVGSINRVSNHSHFEPN